MTRDILINDRLWFDSYPFAIVRFRRQHAEEFATPVDQSQQATVFVTSFCTKLLHNGSGEPQLGSGC